MENLENLLVLLQKRLGIELKAINAAGALSERKLEELAPKLRGIDSGDTSIVVYGSLARGEFTEGSDIDWTLLVDGCAEPNYLEVAREVDRIISESVAKPPGKEGTFGALTFSHELVHQIGGQEDSNRNSTRRILLLLESKVLGRSEAHERVVKNLLRRYILEDSTFVKQSAKHHVPRFLMNDFARQWWTMAVDFAYKHRTRAGRGAAIRNLKLRMSRKMIYVSGLLSCFSCDIALGLAKPIVDCAKPGEGLECVRSVRGRLQTPLETLSRVLLEFPHLNVTASKVLTAYDGFLDLLSDQQSRKHLEDLDQTQFETDAIFQRGRSLSHNFRDGILELFFDRQSGLHELTKEYGVF
jgi:predicted nucleotidyltransferase